MHKGRSHTDKCPEHAHQPAAVDADGSGAMARAAREDPEQVLQPQEPQPDAEAKPMKCPLGFGSDNTAKLDPLNCVLCRSLYHEARNRAVCRKMCMTHLGSHHRVLTELWVAAAMQLAAAPVY